MGRFITKDPYTWGPDDPRILMPEDHQLSYLIKHMVLTFGIVNPQNQHRYMYCWNNPVNCIDPWGLATSRWQKFKNWVTNFLKGALDAFWPGSPITATECVVEAVKAAPDIIEHYQDIDEVLEEFDEFMEQQ